MTKATLIRILLTWVAACSLIAAAIASKGYYIQGQLELGDEWKPVVYLSHVEAFGRMQTISAAMIFDMAEVDSTGHFKFEGKYLLPGDNLYRIHVCKAGDPVSTIIVGGQEHNHVNFAMRPGDSVVVTNQGPVFSSVGIHKSPVNKFILGVNKVVEDYKASGMNTAGSLRMRKEDAADVILAMSDSCSNDLGKLFGAYVLLNRFESTGAARGVEQLVAGIDLEETLYGAEVAFLADFKSGESDISPADSSSNFQWIGAVLAALAAVVLAWWIVQQGQRAQGPAPSYTDISQLSPQERKVFAMLTDGKTNKEISQELNIGINTVKSHVQRIYKKLNIKSRREVLDLKGTFGTQ